jgi:hypothetical protein
MKRSVVVLGTVLISILMMHAVFAQDNVETIIGTVVAVDWDDDDNPIEIAISTEDEDIIVASNDIGLELFQLIDNVIKATGTIELNEDDEKVITISSYVDLGPAEDEAEEEDEPGL